MFGRRAHSRKAVARTPTFIQVGLATGESLVGPFPRGLKTSLPDSLEGRRGGRDLIPRTARDQNPTASGAAKAWDRGN